MSTPMAVDTDFTLALARYARETTIMAACVTGAESAFYTGENNETAPVVVVANRAREMYREITKCDFGEVL